MLTYSPRDMPEDLVDFGPLSNLNAVPIEGDVTQTGRADFGDPTMNIVVGVWHCSRGKFEMTYPFNEAFTVMSGEVTLHQDGQPPTTLKPGASAFLQKGETAIWEVNCDDFRKSYFIFVPDQSPQ